MNFLKDLFNQKKNTASSTEPVATIRNEASNPKVVPKGHIYAITETPNINELSDQSKNRFPEKVLEMLMRAGWYEGRKIDVTKQLERYKEAGFETFDILPKFLEEFDKITFQKYSTFQNEKYHALRGEDYGQSRYNYFDAEKAISINKTQHDRHSARYKAIAKAIKEKFVPIGQDQYQNIFFLTESGKIYGNGWYSLKRLGVTIDEGVSHLIHNDWNTCELSVINQDLDILSTDEIISKGEYCENEPDIKDFEANAINSGRTNYIRYSKYSNGNIKHYYHISANETSSALNRKYTYKVTYYESGKLKTYTITKVNDKNIKTYEWYIHGEIKSIIEYSNNNYITYINYAENGAFIERISEEKKYLGNYVQAKHKTSRNGTGAINAIKELIKKFDNSLNKKSEQITSTQAEKAVESIDTAKEVENTNTVKANETTQAVKAVESTDTAKAVENTNTVKANEATHVVKTVEDTNTVKTTKATSSVKTTKTPDITKLSDESKKRFSEQAMEMLSLAGWYEGRKTDVAQQLEYYKKSGFETFDILPKFLEEFGQLYLKSYSTFRMEKSYEAKGEYYKPMSHYFDAERAVQCKKDEYATPLAQCKAIADAIKEKCVPIGQTQYKNIIFLTESGKIYEDAYSLRRLGVTIDEGISCIINDSQNSCKLCILNQDLGILSNDEIISNGKYSENEPDIKDFEMNVIDSGKKDHIIYSKYSNGNIKHYYQITSEITNNTTDYQYVYKVEYYESGKLKAYTFTPVKLNHMHTYEWYENGEIKSVIDYYRNEVIAYKNYDENGAFIKKEIKHKKYSSSDFYNQKKDKASNQNTATQAVKTTETPDTTKLSDESKKRFSEDVLELLLFAGWYEGRKIDVTKQLEYYKECGFETFDILPKFLEEFDQLSLTTFFDYKQKKKQALTDEEYRKGIFDKFDALAPMHLKKHDYEELMSRYKAVADAIKEKCVPIGKDRANYHIFLSESGKLYRISSSPIRLGVTIEEGISCIIDIDRTNSCKVSILNQELDILSEGEITSIGEYSDNEPDIKDFEINSIALCKSNSFKTNHIIYSKHNNGNIKYYYQLTSTILNNIINFRYVYKVTFYKSGKLKSYTETMVNKTNITTYEWYEHGEIKSIIEYDNNKRITYKNYAENGAFIDKKNKSTKYSNSDFYNQEQAKKEDKSTATLAKKEIYTPSTDNLSDESKNRFSKKTLEILLRAGWYEGRKIDVTTQLEYYKKCDFETFDILPKFLEEFDKLYFKKYDVFQIEQRHESRGEKYKAKAYSYFDATKNRHMTQYEYYTGIDQCMAISETVKEKCVPIGQDQSNNTIFLTESGKIYLNGHFPKRLGSTIDEGINSLIDNDYNSYDSRILNQDLGILSADVIVAKGKKSGYEPEIKDFEITVINLGKKNYIMYSTYSNGNIKHYYQYKTHVQRFMEYKYVYKVTFYESGKLKSYTETKVNSTDITTYEWYEHEALKSVIEYHRNNSIICKSYDKNGDFIDRTSKKEQYITNDVYLKREADKKPDALVFYTDKAIKSKIVPKGHKYAIDEIPDTSKLSAKSKQRFPKTVLQMLMRVGWYEGRKIDVTSQLKRYEQCGFEIFDILPKFLEEFDKLYFCSYRTFNSYRDAKLKNEYTYDSPTRDYFDAEKAMYIDEKRFNTPEKIKTIANSVQYTDLAEEIKERFVPIGQAYMNLYLTESGKMYMDVGPLERIGVTIEEGITHLIDSTRGGCPAYIINKDLHILSADEITAKGEYSDDEPDIEVFNNIFAEKKDYIMYSKYNNGNIKHYYQLITHEDTFHKYQPVTKVTYYESGKLKSYTRTTVGEKDTSTYEWHENGEIKSIINYGNAGRSHRKFDENGAFIC